MCQKEDCTTQQSAALRAQIKDFSVLFSILLYRKGPYVITLADKMPFSINGQWHLGDVPLILEKFVKKTTEEI